jgi:hypothetical protein
MSKIERSKPFMKEQPVDRRKITVKIPAALKKRMQHFVVDMQSTGIDQDELVTVALEEYLSKRGC